MDAQGDPAPGPSRPWARRRVLLASVATVVALAAAGIGLTIALAGGEQSSLRDAALQFNQYAASDIEPIEAFGQLPGVADDSDLVGTGEIVDLRLAYAIDSGQGPTPPFLQPPFAEQQMVIVIQPDRLASGEALLGRSGLIYIDHAAPPLVIGKDGDRDEVRRLDLLRKAAVGGRVAFFLQQTLPDGGGIDGTGAPKSGEDSIINEFAGRDRDDPLFWVTHPSAFLAIDEARREAFPILTTDPLDEVARNIDALAELGVQVDRFTTPDKAGGLGTSTP